MYNFQKTFEMADENIRIEEERLKEEKQEEIRRKEQLESKIMANTEELANSIGHLLIETLSNVKSKTGTISSISDISKHCGEPSKTKWELDNSKFQIKLDFSWESASDQYYYTGPTRGFITDNINWEYLCGLLQQQGISLERLKSCHTTDKWNALEYYRHVDILVITIERQKQLELDMSNCTKKRTTI